MIGTASAYFQTIGRALMLPIAVLPIAGLILRFGQPDLLDLPFLAAAGNAIFANLGLLFAVGIAVGLARENNGAAALAGIVAFLIASNGAQALVAVPAAIGHGLDAASHALAVTDFRAKAIGRLGVPLGILSGVASGMLYNRFWNIKLPEFLAFFGGKRFVPIMAGLAGVVLAIVFGLGWPALAAGIDGLSSGIQRAGPWGLFAYGVLNRILIVTGLHHILNNVVWFIVGDYHGATGDLNRFVAGDPTAGGFMSGFFPVMMFGLPAACLAMYRNALPGQRKAVAGMYLSLALTSFLTGVTEPIEFTFMFVAPLLYALHALLTGTAMMLMSLLGVHLGFGFSAGLLDYVLNYGRATRPLLLVPVGAAYALVYYFCFSLAIRFFDLKTPGRTEEPATATTPTGANDRASGFVAALGGPGNLRAVEACTTRLRLTLADSTAIDEAALKRLGARGVIRPGANALQVVLGPIADQVADDIRRALARTRDGDTQPEPRPAGIAPGDELLPDAIVALLGGADNIVEVLSLPDRLLVSLRHPASVQATVIETGPIRALAAVNERSFHLLRA